MFRFRNTGLGVAGENISLEPDNSFDMERLGEEIEEVNLAHDD